MHVEAALRALEKERPESPLEVGLHLQKQHLGVGDERIGPAVPDRSAPSRALGAARWMCPMLTVVVPNGPRRHRAWPWRWRLPSMPVRALGYAAAAGSLGLAGVSDTSSARGVDSPNG